MRFSSSRIATSRTLLPAKTETTFFVMISQAVFGGSMTASRLASCLTQSFPRAESAAYSAKRAPCAWLQDVFMAIAADRTAELSLARRRHGAAVRRSRFVRRGRQTRATACPELGSESTHPRCSHRLHGLRREKSSICRRPVTLPCDSLDAVGATRHRHRMPVAWQTAWRIDGTDSMLLIVAISSRNF